MLRNLVAARPGEGHLDRMQDRAWPAGEDIDPAGEQQRLFDAVRDEQHGAAVLLPQLQQPPLHVAAGQSVERAERLIQEHKLLGRQQRAEKGGALLHAARQRVRIRGFESAETRLREPAPRFLAGFASRRAFQLAGENDVVLDAAPRQQRRLLRHIADAASLASDGLAAHRDRAGIRPDQSSDDLEQCAFAAAGRPDDRHELLASDRQGDVVQDL
ncbi:hypothetical protein D3C81_236470 [compost metagenome]